MLDFSEAAKPRYYQLSDGRLWDIEEGCWCLARASSEEVLPLIRASDGVSDEHYLRETLKFYNKPLGELAEPADAIKNIISQHKDFLLDILILESLGFEPPAGMLEDLYTVKDKLAKAMEGEDSAN